MKEILLVDDDAIVTHLYRMVFEREGLRVRTAGDGEAALHEIEVQAPDLLVLDLMLPKIHGIEIIKRLRAQPKTASIPVIVLSNSYLATMVKAAWQAGANQCLTKAECSPEKLSEVVRGYLGLAAKPAAPAAQPTAPGGAATIGATTEPSSTGNTQSFTRTTTRQSRTLLAQEPDGQGGEDIAAARRLAAFLPPVVVALKSAPSTIDTLQAQNLFLPKLRELHGLISPPPQFLGNTGGSQVAKLASTLESMLAEVLDDPESLCFSVLRSTAGACEVLAQCLETSEGAARGKSTPPLVLVVDDEVISRKTAAAALEVAELRAIQVDDPELALRLLKDNIFDVVLMDVEMPGMDGYQACERLRQIPIQKQTPVIFVTGATAMESRARSLLSGANDMIAKPFLLQELALKALTHICRVQSKAAKPAR